jgi:hypothetical protein
MTHRTYSARIVAQFLEDALAGGGIGVPDLEVKARAAGLLGAHQRISHAKLFKTAKKVLGIRSVRNGFGSTGQWLWLLDKQGSPKVTETSAQRIAGGRTRAVEDTYEERDVTKDVPADLPVRRAHSCWVEGVARLGHDCPFPDIPAHRRRQFLSGCKNFVASGDNWAERAAQLGWDGLALFGCHRDRPLMYLGSAGLVWAINGGKAIKLERDWAVIEVPDGSQRVFHRRRQDPKVITLPWIWRLQSAGR